MQFDYIVLAAVNGFALRSSFGAAGAVLAAVPLIWAMAGWYLVAFVWHKHGGLRELIALTMGACAAYVSNALVAQVWFRLRPFTAGAATLLISQPAALKSFPSDHATIAFFIAVLLTAHRRGWWVSFLLAALVALGRVAVGVHYPTDVLAGALVGTVFGLTTVWLEDVLARRWPKARVG